MYAICNMSSPWDLLGKTSTSDSPLRPPSLAPTAQDQVALEVMPSLDSNLQSAVIACPSSSPHLGRRVGCDRCRGQELKCIREDENGRCFCCTVANTTSKLQYIFARRLSMSSRGPTLLSTEEGGKSWAKLDRFGQEPTPAVQVGLVLMQSTLHHYV